MILVDIDIPALDTTYDFNLDEYSRISLVLDEIIEILQQTTQGSSKLDSEKLMLGSYSLQQILPGNASLHQCGIHTGERLFLV